MGFKSAVIYYMSGTGNSYRAANRMAEAARNAGVETSVHPTNISSPKTEIKNSPDQLVGLVFPTHGFIAPWHVIRFAMRMPEKKGACAFVVATRGGTKFGKVFVSGLSGTAIYVIALILFFKGYKVLGGQGLNMPSNWMSLHPGYSKNSANAIIDRSKPNNERFINNILQRQRAWFTLSNLFELVFGLLLLPISILYLFLGRFFLAKIFFANNLCTGCGLCAQDCPIGAIKMIGKENPRPFWKYNCESCMRCMGFCPEKAIEASHSWVVLLMYLTSIPVGFYFSNWILGSIGYSPEKNGELLERAFQLGFNYVVIFSMYYPLHIMSRTKFLNTLLTYTTFTKLYRRYHEPSTTRKQVVGKRVHDK